MKPVEVHKYKTPLDGNIDCQWSVGVLNLTEAECLLIAEFARGVRSIAMRGVSATDMRGDVERSYADIRQKRAAMRDDALGTRGLELRGITAAERDARIARAREAYRDDPKYDYVPPAGLEPWDGTEPVLEPERNRFSGLDIPAEEKPK